MLLTKLKKYISSGSKLIIKFTCENAMKSKVKVEQLFTLNIIKQLHK